MMSWIGVPAYSVLYVFGRFTYDVIGERLVIRWRIFHFLPIYRKSFDLGQFVSVRRFRFPRDLFSFATPLGNTFSRNRAILEFKGWRTRRLVVTPRNFEEFRQLLIRHPAAAPSEL